MLNVIVLKDSAFVSLKDFYDYAIEDKRNYARWVKNFVTEQPSKIPIEGVDYIEEASIPIKKMQRGRGRKRKDYLISVEFLKQLCMDIKTAKCRDIRLWANTLR